MTNYKEKAEQYVRSHLPELRELSFGCEIYDADAVLPWTKRLKLLAFNGKTGTIYCQEQDGSIFQRKTKLERYEIIGHPIQLQHWFEELLPEPIDKHLGRELTVQPNGKCVYHEVDHITMTAKTIRISFNLTTGQPATPEDYQAFCEIVGI